MASRRISKVNELIHHEISNIIQKKLNDPRIGFVTVSDVDVAPDLKSAKIYVTVFGTDEEKDNALEGLNSACSFIRRELAGRVKLRVVPELLFKFDNTLEKSDKILQILDEIKKDEITTDSDNEE